jgi:hypothetical protein
MRKRIDARIEELDHASYREYFLDLARTDMGLNHRLPPGAPRR